MKILKGNMFDPDGRRNLIILATTNGTLFYSPPGTMKPTLIMGGGAAKDLAVRQPHLPRLFGEKILMGKCPTGSEWNPRLQAYKYGIVLDNEPNEHPKYGGFQTKWAVGRNTTPEILTDTLIRFQRVLRYYPGYTWKINFPGIGLGGMRFQDVEPILKAVEMGDQVEFYYL